MKGSVKEPNMFHNCETEKITRKASDVAENPVCLNTANHSWKTTNQCWKTATQCLKTANHFHKTTQYCKSPSEDRQTPQISPGRPQTTPGTPQICVGRPQITFPRSQNTANHCLKTAKHRKLVLGVRKSLSQDNRTLQITQGVIFREYSRQSTATTHYFPWKFWLVIEANIRQVSLVSRFVTVTE